MTTLTGVSIIVDTSKRSEWEAPALAVGNALHAAGIETAVQEVSDGSVSKDALRIGVGAKP